MIIPERERSPLPLEGPAVLDHPDMERAWRHVAEAYEPPRRDLCLFLTCSVHRPYHESPSHRAYDRAVAAVAPPERVHVVVFGTCGVVPRELDGEYPFTAYRFVLGRAEPAVRRAFVPREALRLSRYLERTRGAYGRRVAYCLGEFREAMLLAREASGVAVDIAPREATIASRANARSRFPPGSLRDVAYLQDLADAVADALALPRRRLAGGGGADADEDGPG